MTVQRNLEFLRDAFDKNVAKIVFGTTTVPQGATNVVASHTLGASTYAAVATPQVNPGGNWWISNKATTSFQLNLAVAAPVGGITFDWILKGG